MEAEIGACCFRTGRKNGNRYWARMEGLTAEEYFPLCSFSFLLCFPTSSYLITIELVMQEKSDYSFHKVAKMAFMLPHACQERP